MNHVRTVSEMYVAHVRIVSEMYVIHVIDVCEMYVTHVNTFQGFLIKCTWLTFESVM